MIYYYCKYVFSVILNFGNHIISGGIVLVKSMTGFGRASAVADGVAITVEIKSVNHRYLELNARIPRAYMQLEDNIRSYISTRLSRGKLDLNLNLDFSAAESNKKVSVDKKLLKNYLDEMSAVAEEFGLTNDISASTVLRLPDVVTVSQDETDSSQMWLSVKPVLEEAVDALLKQREAEGTRLCADISAKLETIKDRVAVINARVPVLTEEYASKLRKRIEKILGSADVDEQRLLTEVAIMADKTAIDEEVVRLGSHAAALEEALCADKPIGKYIDNSIQEMNREVNTISSKIGDLEVTRIVLELKSIIEQIREQIQNIE